MIIYQKKINIFQLIYYFQQNSLFQILLKSANFSHPSFNQIPQQNVQYMPVQPAPTLAPSKPGYLQSTLNNALNAAAQSVQPKFSVALAPSISFGQ